MNSYDFLKCYLIALFLYNETFATKTVIDCWTLQFIFQQWPGDCNYALLF